MKEWQGCVQINGDSVTFYDNVKFDISDELYNKIQEAVKNDIPVAECDFCSELEGLADNSVDILELVEPDIEELDPDDYDDEEDYREALEEYKSETDPDSVWSDYFVEHIWIYDPGEEKRFKKQFIGKKYPVLAGKNESPEEYSFSDGWEGRDYSIKVHFDSEGTITDITDITAKGLESESVNSSSWGGCYLDYKFISESLIDKLS